MISNKKMNFKEYLESDLRISRVKDSHQTAISKGYRSPLPVEEILSGVHHSDLKNWEEDQKKYAY